MASIETKGGSSPALVCLDPVGDIWRRLRSLFDDPSVSDEFVLTRTSDSGAALVELCRNLIPAIIVAAEASLDGGGPINSTRGLLKLSGIQVLIVSEKTDLESLEGLLRKGCSGVIPMDASDEMLLQAFRSLFSGELWFPRKVVCRIAREAFLREPAPKLTRRESDILHLISRGHTNQQIADHFFISRETVRWHIRSLYSKIGVDDRQGAIREARLFQECAKDA